MDIRILKASAAAERREWEAAWSRLPAERRDVYFHPAYLFAFEAEGRGQAACAVVEEGARLWLYPFMRHPLEGGAADIESPYGYGGPVVSGAGEDSAFLERAAGLWTAFCAESGIVSEFVRFHPLLDNRRWACPGMRVLAERKTIPIPLEQYPTRVWSDPYYRRHRNMIRKAEREDCRFEVLPAGENLDWFVPLYAATQDRLNAKADTRLGERYFASLARGLGERSWLGVVRRAAAVAAAVFVMESDAFAHSHLMGSDPEKSRGGAANLVYHGIALEAANRGRRTLHMGGGLGASGEDPLYKFKTGLGPDRAQFWLGTRCHDAQAYARLGAAWEERNGPRPQGFLQFYRLSKEDRS